MVRPLARRSMRFGVALGLLALTACLRIERVAAPPPSPDACASEPGCARDEPAEPRVIDRDPEGELLSIDRCPDLREVVDGLQDADGCPDPPSRRACPYQISPQVFFARARSTAIDRDAAEVLRDLVRMFAEHPERVLEVRGHVAVGEVDGAAAIERLARLRAERVRTYLIRRLAVAPERLITRSLGTSSPYPCGHGAVDPRDRRVDFGLAEPAPPTAAPQ